MMPKTTHYTFTRFTLFLLVAIAVTSCFGVQDNEDPMTFENDGPVLLIIDEESIDNDSAPNFFSATDVNDQMAEVGQRAVLDFFARKVDQIIELYTGEVGDEGWFALSSVPDSWKAAGPTDQGGRNYLTPGPGLGAPDPDDDQEVLLQNIDNLIPLRAMGISMLQGQTVLAVVYDSDVSVNYSPLQGNLMGSNLGLVAFDVLQVTERTDSSNISLPSVTLRIRDAAEVTNGSLKLFVNAPIPVSSSDPLDISPSGDPTPIVLADAP